ncbi:MAG TPA: DUF1349 domain-containing protein [Spirochaeta sp.]|nr:DUF1349 domain-containing protein [Spirochaeta sp.]
MTFDLNRAEWIFEPKKWVIEDGTLEIKTEPDTDFWQRTFYGFRNDNSPALLLDTDENFTFAVKTSFEYNSMYDQCGLLVYIDGNNWVKAGLEYENEEYSRLGSVVTNTGYSDWATTDIPNRNEMYYRLHRRGPDFMFESSFNGIDYRQMRIFHMHVLGETTLEMGKQAVMTGETVPVRFGLYASSPGNSSFTARFSDIELTESCWKAH